jgi:hypothetical protein
VTAITLYRDNQLYGIKKPTFRVKSPPMGLPGGGYREEDGSENPVE